ncbi:MAG: alpha/beta hydrolase [Deltaproteobacteria bacterium]
MRFMEQELVSIPFNRSKIDGLYYHSTIKDERLAEKDAVVIHIHGFLGNFLDGSQRFLPPVLAEGGYSSLAINTRMANFGLFFGYGLLDDTIPQIDRAVEYLVEMGYKKIILSGYSLGTCIVLRYAYLRSDAEKYPHLKGVITLAAPYSMPDSIRRRWNRWGSEPAYDEVYQESKEILKPDPYNSKNDRTILIYKARGDTYQPWHTEIYTYKTWWFLAGPEAETAKAYLKMGRIKIPILLIQGWYDDVVQPEETQDLAQIAIQAGNQDVSAFYVNAGHTFEGKDEELGDIIVRWLDRRFKE